MAMKVAKKAAKKKAAAKPSAAKKKVAGTVSASGAALVGAAVPALNLSATSGRTITLKSLKGRHVVLYFYPKDATPGCTTEGGDFSRLLPEFAKAGCEVFGVSRDTLASHEKFKAKEGYGFDLISDSDETLCAQFGVIKMKNMYGRQVRGIERSTFVIDRDGRLVKEWRGVKVPGHAEEVLEFVQSLD